MPLLWTSCDISSGVQSHSGYPVLSYLHAMNSSDSPLVRHPLTFWWLRIFDQHICSNKSSKLKDWTEPDLSKHFHNELSTCFCVGPFNSNSSGSSGRVHGGATRNMKSMRLPLTAIFFMTYFYRARGESWPPRAPWISY